MKTLVTNKYIMFGWERGSERAEPILSVLSLEDSQVNSFSRFEPIKITKEIEDFLYAIYGKRKDSFLNHICFNSLEEMYSEFENIKSIVKIANNE